MTDFIFGILESIGFTHPVHPAMVHLPMGLIMGGFAFVAAAVFLKQQELFKTAHYCSVLALIGIPPTVFLGYLDWQYRFEGEWLTSIQIKIGLAVVMTILLAVIVKLDGRSGESPYRQIVLHGLTLLTAIGMGYTGGELVF